MFLYAKHRKKYEIATDEDFTPIKQDEKKGKLREVRVWSFERVWGDLLRLQVFLTFLFSVVQFKKGDIFFNYGCFPQTWEDPTFVHPDAEGCRGDNDPLDVCEIGARIVKCGVSDVGGGSEISTNIVGLVISLSVH